MGIHSTKPIESGTIRKAPGANGPRVEVLIDDNDQLAVAHVHLPPGGGMPKHMHGESVALVAVREGRVEISCEGRQETLEPGSVALFEVGEQVSLHNPGDQPASLLAFFAPPGFIQTFSNWPVLE